MSMIGDLLGAIRYLPIRGLFGSCVSKQMRAGQRVPAAPSAPSCAARSCSCRRVRLVASRCRRSLSTRLSASSMRIAGRDRLTVEVVPLLGTCSSSAIASAKVLSAYNVHDDLSRRGL